LAATLRARKPAFELRKKGRVNSWRLSFPAYSFNNWGLNMRKLFKAFAADEQGATAIEYGLIAALIAVVIITGLTAVGTNLNTMMGTVATDLR
jgi:pilus assembly protein Flp/PilA